ncbi:hypothetical protein JRO89_XS02G0289600 [Xanthoceras sorbifolium]|uniref:Protein kinase domain-containing protein n=1 Tax=Xanthoceras sorbifolium TaxID=99658 RepID=A0ABQ8IHV5_9ROSI|nr:hypothetical protein JRO89_XS02G0289600 [Xanthoceras sorbifolium]
MERALRSFDVECEVLSGIRHRNLVKILAVVQMRTLKPWLNKLIDVASALEYLHFGYSIPIVHSDIKLSNVLLDQDMVGHLSDFGIAKLLGEEESMTQTQTLATFVIRHYGIMLMETFTKKKSVDEIFTEEMSLRQRVGDSFNRSVMEVVDNDLLLMEDTHFLIQEQCVIYLKIGHGLYHRFT